MVSTLKQYLEQWEQQLYRPRPVIHTMPTEVKEMIMRELPQQSLASLSQTCKSWQQLAIPILYERDAREGNSSAMIWAARADDGEKTEVAMKVLEKSAMFGGQVNELHHELPVTFEHANFLETVAPIHYAVLSGNLCIVDKLLDMGAHLDISCTGSRRWAEQVGLSKNIDIILFMYSFIFDENDGSGLGHWFPLFLAFITGHDRMGKLLLRRGAPLDAIHFFPHPVAWTRVLILPYAISGKTDKVDDWKFLFEAIPSSEIQASELSRMVMMTGRVRLRLANFGHQAY